MVAAANRVIIPLTCAATGAAKTIHGQLRLKVSSHLIFENFL